MADLTGPVMQEEVSLQVAAIQILILKVILGIYSVVQVIQISLKKYSEVVLVLTKEEEEHTRGDQE